MYYRTLYTVETLKEMIENIDIYISYDDNQMPQQALPMRRSLCYPADTIQEVPHNLQLLHLQIPDPEDLRKKNVHISC